MKKLVSALIGAGLLFSGSSFAFSPDCYGCGYNGTLAAPKYNGGFYVGVSGYWLRAAGSGDDLNLETIQFGTLAGALNLFAPLNSRSDVREFPTKYRWDWGVTVGYDLPCSANNIELSYFEIHNTLHSDFKPGTAASIAPFNFTNALFPFGDRAAIVAGGPVPGEFLYNYSERDRLRYKLDQFDIKFGRNYTDVCGCFKFHPSVGVRFARLEKQLNTHSETGLVQSGVGRALGLPQFLDFDSQLKIDTALQSKFRGVGPMAAVDLRYGFCGGFGIVGHFDTSLLVGKFDGSARFVNDMTFLPFSAFPFPVPGSEFTEDQRFNVPSKQRLVTTLGGKVGIDYGMCLCNKSSINVELGYQATRYFDALQQIRGDISFPPFIFTNTITPPFQRLTSANVNDFDFHGPYVNVTWHL